MAALTQGAIDGLLGVLSKAITDEAQLIGGVPGDMQFIRDEMDSMNGFLLHLTKTEGQHDDQVRAWMKQVREIAYVAEDCVQRYIHDMVPHEAARYGRLGALAAMARLLLFHPKKYWQLHDLGKQITELKVRVRDVGERRMRYGVTVPAGPDLKLAPMTPAGQQEEKRLAFVRALEWELEEDVVGSKAWWRAHHQAWLRTALRSATAVGGLLPAALPSAVLRYISVSREIVRRLPPLLQSEAATVHGILKKCSPQGDGVDDAAAFRCTKRMFLCALYAYPYTTNRELEKLKEKLEGSRAQDPKKEVMTFCYSMLSISQKSSLQYITAFFHESEISRTSMVRRWVAEGLVGKEPGGGGGGGRTPEEEGECCFSELVFRGFIRPARFSDAGTVKSCVMEKPVCDFILGITESENFEVSLPAHLERQLKIREIVQQIQPPPQQQEQRLVADCWKTIIARRCNNLCSDNAWPEEDHPMDALVDFLKKLPELYRLNVLDLGGCKGLKRRHLKSFGGVVWLKYLSLRNTDVSHLPACHINKLTLLETLDIRGTSIRPRDTKKINLPKLKHLLAGRYLTPGEKVSLITVRVPRKIGSMRCMETLSHVQVSKDGTELRGVAKLRQLRKLGVVVHGSTAHLGPVLHALSGCLRSLSVYVTTQGWALDEDSSSSTQEMTMAPRPNFILENLDIKGKISGLPSWITKAQKLANVTLRHTELSGEDALRRLSSVLSLRCLKLSGGAFTEQELVFKVVVQFKALKILVLEGGPITTVTFLAADVAPALEKIVWAIGSRVRDGEDLIVGINYLPNLKAIELRGDFKTTSLMDWVQATAESTSDPRYRIRYMSSTASVGNQLITEVPKTARHTTVSIPVAVINQH